MGNNVREYQPSDLQIVTEWWADHGEGAFPSALLPPVGIVVEDDAKDPIAACWLYLAVGVGVCWLEYPVSRPGLSLRTVKAAFADAIGALEKIALSHDYGVMLAHTLPPIARLLGNLGFIAEKRTKVTAGKPLR